MGAKVEGMWDLLNAGDWACAHADEETLGRIAESLARDLAGDYRMRALLVAASAERDMREASARWGSLADRLRERAERNVD